MANLTLDFKYQVIDFRRSSIQMELNTPSFQSLKEESNFNIEAPKYVYYKPIYGEANMLKGVD